VRGRSATVVTRDEMDERLARSAPDALRYVPGVSVQQTTHGQASPYVRGLTGQQVLIAFDGVRMNNGVYRQGPNQYFFTVDAATIDRIEVLRGSASTRWGSDALGGAILAHPSEPLLDPTRDGLTLRPRAFARFGSQDLDLLGRAEIEAQLGRDVAFLGGGGYRAAQQLQASGILTNPADGRPAAVPFFEADGRTQRGTGFRHGTFDARLVARIAPGLRATAALYGFRQYDTPRADQCPPVLAPERECMIFLEQFRTLAYVSIRGDAGPELRDVDITLSYQRQHELRLQDRPLSFVRHTFRDSVDTFGLALRGSSRRHVLAPGLAVRMRAGGDAYLDLVSSVAWIELTDLQRVTRLPRGQYSDGSRFAQLGLYAELDTELFGWLRVRGGVRYARASARAPAESESATQRVRADFDALVGRLGVEARIAPELQLLANVDQGFRAPNLDDLTSRQQAGPGFQFENAALAPERSTTFEIGARARAEWMRVEAWAYAMMIEGAIIRSLREARDCPPATPACVGSWSRFQLINVRDPSWVLGGEVALRVDSPIGLGGTATLAAAWGEGPNPAERPSDPLLPYTARVPLSRIPPVNGTIELRYANSETRLVVGAAMRWAAAQDRLAPADTGDARIPVGGTPAYATFDLRAGWRFERYVQVNAVFENLFDQVYRVHGSGINGPGRGVIVQVEGAY
jgi:iron complex outermembrane receptor protein/hemoglobin/transferrin/lactoferrin receptor protein